MKKSVYLSCALATPTMWMNLFILQPLIALITASMVIFLIVKIIINKRKQLPIFDVLIRNLIISSVGLLLYLIISNSFYSYFNSLNNYYYNYWLLAIVIGTILFAIHKTINKGLRVILIILFVIIAVISVIVTVGVTNNNINNAIDNTYYGPGSNAIPMFGSCGGTSLF